MYLKKVTNKKKLKVLQGLMPFKMDGTWYRKMNEDGTQAKNERGFYLYSCLADSELKHALESGEFTRVEE